MPRKRERELHKGILYFSQDTKGGSITVLLTSSLTGLDLSVWQIQTKIVSCHAADSKPVKQEVSRTVILPPFSIPCFSIPWFHAQAESAGVL